MHYAYKAESHISNDFDVVLHSVFGTPRLLPPDVNIWVQIKSEGHVHIRM